MTDDEGKSWDPELYDGGHGYVHEYGYDVLDLLDPQPGERILDLGCGTGHLTREIADAVGDAGTAVGIDASAEMIAEARDTYPDVRFEVADATEYTSDTPYDAVFSNAALHWIDDQAAVAARMADALAPAGRFVAELGGAGNVSSIVDALTAALAERGVDPTIPYHFPTVGEHASLLEAHGFEVRYARLFDRPTELEGGEDGLRNWIEAFGDTLLAALAPAEREAVIADVEQRLRENRFDPATDTWTADYRRLRFVAALPD